MTAFPDVDPVGVLADSSEVGAARALARDLLAPGAAAADAHGLPRSTIDALAAAGLMDPGLPPEVLREVSETVFAGDGTAWFCWAQHFTPAKALRAAVADDHAPCVGDLQRDYLGGLGSGRLLAAVAFAHLRRSGPPTVVAERTDLGWRLHGRLDWVTSWDIADVVLVMAQGTPPYDDRVVSVLLDAIPHEGLEVGPVMDLLAMGGTHTRPIEVHGLDVPLARVVSVVDRSDWIAQDVPRASNAGPQVFGLARAVIAELAALADRHADPGVAALVDSLAREVRAIRAAAYAEPDGLEARARLRALALDAADRSIRALVAAQSGAAMTRGTVAERRSREATFLQVQAQTRLGRDATIDLVAGLTARSPSPAL